MVTLETLRRERREEILRLARRRGAHDLRVFGSVARGEAKEGSDLDLLVAWEREAAGGTGGGEPDAGCDELAGGDDADAGVGGPRAGICAAGRLGSRPSSLI